MQIVLATSPTEEDRHGYRSLPPLSIGYLAATAKTVPGVKLTVVDAYGEDMTCRAAADRILDLKPDLLGVSSTSFCFPSGLRLVNMVKEARPETTTVMGGYHPTFFDRLLLEKTPRLDFVLRGEGDESFPELCRRLLRADLTHNVPGLSYRVNGQVISGVPQQIDDLDTLPFPDRAAMDYPGYFYQFGGFYLPPLPPVANIVSSRACPFHCTFCPKMFPEWRYRTRSAENIFQELLELRAQGYEMAFFQDENFSHRVDRLENLCRMIMKHNLKMRFAFQGTIHHLPEHVFKLLHRAGFDALFVGVETGSDDQLKRYRKPSTNRTMAQGIRRAKKAHMVVIGFFIHGGPGETMADTQATNQFIREVKPHVCGASELSVQPGTILWQELMEGMVPQSIDDSKPRIISRFPEQQTVERMEIRKKSFQRAMALSWRNISRLGEIIDLMLHNRSAQRVLTNIIKDVKWLLQLIKGGPKGWRDPRSIRN